MKYAKIRGGAIVGVVNWDGKEEHPYGDLVELRGPLPDSAGTEWVGKPLDQLDDAIGAKTNEPMDAVDTSMQIISVPDAVLQQAATGPNTGDAYIIYGDKAYRRKDGVWTVMPKPRDGDRPTHEPVHTSANSPANTVTSPGRNPETPAPDTFKPSSGNPGTGPRNPAKDQVVEQGKPFKPVHP